MEGEKKLKILLVEDDEVDLIAFERLVKKEKLPYDYFMVRSVSEGIKVVTSENFDVVIMDYFLKDGTAFDILTKIPKGIPTIIVTGTGNEEIAVKAMKLGASDYLIKDPNGNYLKTLPLTVENAIKTKYLEAQLRHAQKMECIGTLVSGIAHNFRNILTAILGSSEFIQLRYHNDPQLVKIADRINNLVKRGAQLIDELMRFSYKQVSQKYEHLNLSEIIKEIYELIVKSFDKKIKIQLDIPKYLPIKGNYSDLSQVIMNICTNARDAMPNGGTLFIKAKEKGNYLEIIISDTGIGMDRETQRKCFDPFFTTKERGKGTGLGLSTSYWIVKNHGGDIHVYSEIGKGTIFKIYFPKTPLEKDKKYEIICNNNINKGKGEKILIVDDEEEVVQSMEQILKSLGYNVISTTSAEDAINKYKSVKPDIVLMDRNMPGMDGITCTKKIFQFDPHAKIIIISGYEEMIPNGTDFYIKKFIKAYFTKPINIAKLTKTLREILNNKTSDLL